MRKVIEKVVLHKMRMIEYENKIQNYYGTKTKCNTNQIADLNTNRNM